MKTKREKLEFILSKDIKSNLFEFRILMESLFK